MDQKPELNQKHRNLENIGNTHEDIGMGKNLLIRKNTNSTEANPSINS